MPPARSRPAPATEDARSEGSSIAADIRKSVAASAAATQSNTGTGASKGKKSGLSNTTSSNNTTTAAGPAALVPGTASNGTSTTVNGTLGAKTFVKNSAANGAATVAAAAAMMAVAGGKGGAAAGDAEIELPHIDWTTLPIPILHAYRSAYKLQIPSSYTRPHADLVYRSSDVASRAPSVVAARRKLHDLKQYRKKQALKSTKATHANGVNGNGAQTTNVNGYGSNGANKRAKTKDSVNGKKARHLNNASSKAADTSQTLKAKNADEATVMSTRSLSPLVQGTRLTENTSSSAAADVVMADHLIPQTLNQSDPELTVIGQQSPESLANTIRKHFNAQQLNEAETIARFTYVVRQQGSGIQAPNPPISNGSGTSFPPANTTTSTPGYGLGGGHVKVEGSQGDGHGSVMGTHGRQVRMSGGPGGGGGVPLGGSGGGGGGGGGGTFRLRFRP